MNKYFVSFYLPSGLFGSMIKIVVFLLAVVFSGFVIAEKPTTEISDAQPNTQVMQAFTSQVGDIDSEIIKISDEKKHLVLFIMGVPLLILIFITGGLGVAMGVYGKQVFIPHMVFAGLSMTLALGHAVVGVVWFYPF